MDEGVVPDGNVTLRANNIGGIDDAEVEFAPGVNVLAGQNATNRTSLLQAVIGALGGSDVSLKGDAETGETSLTFGGETYTRRLIREGGELVVSGDPLLEDAEIAELFAFLLESNEARRTVAQLGDLRTLIMSPVDTDEIESDIRELKRRKTEIDAEIQEIDSEEARLPELVEEREGLREKIERKTQELDEIQSAIDDRDGRTERTDDTDAELESKLDRRQELKATREDVAFDLQTERQSLESLRNDRDEVESEFNEIGEVSEQKLKDVRSRLSQARERQNVLESTINQMQNIIQFNEKQLGDEEGLFGNLQSKGDRGLFGSFRSEASTDLLGALRTEYEGDQSVTDRLVEDQQVLTCWTCGSQVKRARVQQMVGELQEIRSDQLDLLNEVEAEIGELNETEEELERSARRRKRLEEQRDQLSREIETREERVRELEAEQERCDEAIDDLTEEIEALRAEMDDREDDDYDTVLQLQEDAKELELEIQRHRETFEDVRGEIGTIEERIDHRSELETERSELRDRLTQLRQRVRRIEQRAVNEFNDRMADILDILEYSNIDRIWIERVADDTGEDAGVSTNASFDMHVVRTSDSGSSYRDTIRHLSESEREVTGLVFALAGYLVHDVHESMPFMILDSLEAIDSNRIARLIEYLSAHADYLVVALLPEDAAALDEECRFLSPPW